MTTQTHKTDVLIIGSGMAGMTLVRELRKLDGEKTIHMLTADDGAQYSKPMLSNAFAQNKRAEDLVQKSGSDWAAEQNVVLSTKTWVSAINRTAKTVVVSGPNGREEIGYDQLVLAVGASPRPYAPLGVAPKALPAVNSLADYAAWRRDIQLGDRVLIVGAGLIGVEFANDLAGSGHQVDVVDPAPHPLGRLLPSELGVLMQAKLVEVGVTFHMNQSIQHMTDGEARLTNGQVVDYDHVLSAIGLVANTELADVSGLQTEQGIVVDPFMMTTDPHIYALGDCAQTKVGVLPYIQPLMIQARALAKTLADDPTPVVMPALPVVVKTPALPTVVCPPPAGAEGSWVVEGDDVDRRAVFQGENGQTLGFALTGKATQGRMSLAKEVPDLLAA
ncbi:FAD-dependent oxidoreductase [Magnetovibrio sp. PR-2]|uniref:FAD-dependent oxidoreductase n=1 Tax=Magnetovibrio sp. PR-2 TaxID=3120356 RepID=UPI002FCE5723